MSIKRIFYFTILISTFYACSFNPSYDRDSLSSDFEYEVQKKIGSGFYGETSLIKILGNHNLQLVLKTNKQKKGDTGYLLEKLRNENEILKACDHKGIPKQYAYRSGKLFMEYIEGISLEEYILKNKDLPPKDLLKIAFKVLENLVDIIEYLHDSVNISHNDIHFLNLIVNKEGKLSLIDFGEAKFKENSHCFEDDKLEDMKALLQNFCLFFYFAKEGKSEIEKNKIEQVSEKYLDFIENELSTYEEMDEEYPAKSLKNALKEFKK